MRYARIDAADSTSRLFRLAAALACAAMLSSCRFGEPLSFFADDGGIEQAIATIKPRLNAPVEALSIVVAPDQLAIRVQDNADRDRVAEWRLERKHWTRINWDAVSGPVPYALTLANPNLEANLFDLDLVDFGAAAAIARAALTRAALAGNAQVRRMELARRVLVAPGLASGELRWTVDVSNGRETVQVYADTGGEIVGINLDGTERARNLDIMRELALVADAARSARFVLGADSILTAVSIAPREIAFETSIANPGAPAGARERRAYVWNLNGLQRTVGRTNPAAPARPPGTFSVDDVDWTVLPSIVAAAPERLSMPQGRVTGIELAKSAVPPGAQAIIWKVEVTGQNQEKSVALFDVAGAALQTR